MRICLCLSRCCCRQHDRKGATDSGASLTHPTQMALFQGGCEFPLLRDRFWKLAAAGMPAEADQRMANGSPSPNGKPRQQQQGNAASPPTPPLPELRNGAAQSRPSLRSAASMSVDMGTLQHRREGGGAECMEPAFGGRELSRSESEAPTRGRFGLRSLDLQAGASSASDMLPTIDRAFVHLNLKDEETAAAVCRPSLHSS